MPADLSDLNRELFNGAGGVNRVESRTADQAMKQF